MAKQTTCCFSEALSAPEGALSEDPAAAVTVTVTRGPLEVRGRSLGDGRWDTGLELRLSPRPRCRHAEVLGTSGFDIYLDPATRMLLLYGVVSQNEGGELAVVDPATCRTTWRGRVPYLREARTSGVCLWSLHLGRGTISFVPTWDGAPADGRTCLGSRWLLDLSPTCQPRWRRGHVPPRPSE